MRVTQEPEYKDLLAAQRVLRATIDSGDHTLPALAQGTRALVDVIRLKRDMRGVPDPRPVDVSKPAKRQRRASGIDPSAPTDPGKV